MRVGDRLDVRGPSAVRFRGIDQTAFLDDHRFHGDAFARLRVAERFLRGGLPIAGRIEEGRVERIDEPLVPPLATREAFLIVGQIRRPRVDPQPPHYDKSARSWILSALSHHTDDES